MMSMFPASDWNIYTSVGLAFIHSFCVCDCFLFHSQAGLVRMLFSDTHYVNWCLIRLDPDILLGGCRKSSRKCPELLTEMFVLTSRTCRTCQEHVRLLHEAVQICESLLWTFNSERKWVFIFSIPWYFSDLSEKKSDLRVCDAGTCRFGGTCRENGADIKCVCQFHVSLMHTLLSIFWFHARVPRICCVSSSHLNTVCLLQCHKKYVPVCGSNGDTYQNECFLRRATCKKQRAISIMSEGPCYHGNGNTHMAAADIKTI